MQLYIIIFVLSVHIELFTFYPYLMRFQLFGSQCSVRTSQNRSPSSYPKNKDKKCLIKHILAIKQKIEIFKQTILQYILFVKNSILEIFKTQKLNFVKVNVVIMKNLNQHTTSINTNILTKLILMLCTYNKIVFICYTCICICKHVYIQIVLFKYVLIMYFKLKYICVYIYMSPTDTECTQVVMYMSMTVCEVTRMTQIMTFEVKENNTFFSFLNVTCSYMSSIEINYAYFLHNNTCKTSKIKCAGWTNHPFCRMNLNTKSTSTGNKLIMSVNIIYKVNKCKTCNDYTINTFSYKCKRIINILLLFIIQRTSPLINKSPFKNKTPGKMSIYSLCEGHLKCNLIINIPKGIYLSLLKHNKY